MRLTYRCEGGQVFRTDKNRDMDASHTNPQNWREWRRLQAVRVKQQGWPPRDIAPALSVREDTVSREFKGRPVASIEQRRTAAAGLSGGLLRSSNPLLDHRKLGLDEPGLLAGVGLGFETRRVSLVKLRQGQRLCLRLRIDQPARSDSRR
jgi:hypothetical protein